MPVEGARPPTAVTDPTLASARPPAEAELAGLLTPSEPAIADAWPPDDDAPIRLTGWFERNQFHPLLMALLVFVAAFLLFQLVIAPIVMAVGVVWDLVQNGGGEPPDLSVVMEQLMTNGRLMMTANTIGQFVGFGLFAYMVSRLHTPDVWSFLRVRTPDAKGLGLAALGWAVLYPAVVWTGQVNEMLPLPEFLQQLEQTQVDMMERLLLGNELSTGFLFLAFAITPALCEELLFRGYLQRQVERGWGTATSIVLVGVLFGLYHLRLSQAVPLSLLGVYLGFVVWATGSLWSGVLVHLLNNGLAVMATAYARQSADVDLETIEGLGVPWYLGIGGLVLAALVARALVAHRRSAVGDAPDSRAVDLPQTPPSPQPLSR